MGLRAVGSVLVCVRASMLKEQCPERLAVQPAQADVSPSLTISAQSLRHQSVTVTTARSGKIPSANLTAQLWFLRRSQDVGTPNC
jgi:hypothetical protein